MIFCRWLEHKCNPELRTHPENRSKFDQRNHDEVEECWSIELPSISTIEIASTEETRSRIRSCGQSRSSAIRPGDAEDEGAEQDMPIIGRIRAPYDNIDRWR